MTQIQADVILSICVNFHQKSGSVCL